MTLSEYTSEVNKYLRAKLPDVNHATLYEIAEFFVMKSNNFASDMVADNNKTWQEVFKRHNKQWCEIMKQTYR